MKYDEAVRSEVINQYLGGKPRRQIAETKGIPLSTVRSWTKDIVSAEAMQIKCAVCGKQKRTLNIQQVYCSMSCKNRANYLRRRERERLTSAVPDTRICDYCGKRSVPSHGNGVKYCCATCRKRAVQQRRAVKQAIARRFSEKHKFNQSLETVLQARRDAINDGRISRAEYRTELDTIEQYLRQGNPTPIERESIQLIFRSVK